MIFYKVRKVHLKEFSIENGLEKKLDNLFYQLESLIGLYNDLKFDKSLPRTRGWAGSPDFLINIARLTEERLPYTVLECSSGISTIVLAQRLMLNGKGHVYSLDHDEIFAEKTKKELIRHGLDGWATVIYAPLVNYEINGSAYRWYSLSGVPNDMSVEMIVIDGPPMKLGEKTRYPALPLLYGILKKDGLIVMDDAERLDEKKIIDLWVDEFPDLICNKIVCEKGLAVIEKTTSHWVGNV